MWIALLTPLCFATTPDYAQVAHGQLKSVASEWLKKNGALAGDGLKGSPVAVVELQISAQGGVARQALAISSGHNAADDLLRMLMLAAEPFPAPDPAALGSKGELTCLVRGKMSEKKGSFELACFAAGEALPKMAGKVSKRGDAGGLLFDGWRKEMQGKSKSALSFYQKAVAAAPAWDYAARALGLALANQKRHEEAMPYLQVYLDRHNPPEDVKLYAHQLQRFARYTADRESRFTNPRPRLDKQDLAWGVQDGMEALEECLEKARKERALALYEDTLLVTFKIRLDGSVTRASIDSPENLRMTRHSECLEKAINTAWKFAPYTRGPEMTVKQLPIKVEGSKPQKLTKKPRMSAELADASASIAQCERGQAEIMDYIKKKFPAINDCAFDEKKRAPNLHFPPLLPISFVVTPAGPVERIEVKHRHFTTGPFHDCVVKALSGSFVKRGGARCPATFDLNMKGL